MCDDASEHEECIPKLRRTDSESSLTRDTDLGSFVDHPDNLSENLEAILRHFNRENASFTGHKARRNFNRYMTAIIKVSEFCARTTFGTVPVAGPVVSVVSSAALKVFQENIAETAFALCREYFEEKFRRKCIAKSAIYGNIIRYLLAQPDAHNLASDCPINTGASVIHRLAADIKRLSIQRDLRDISGLMNKVHVYCCLSTLRELFLTARIMMEEKFERRTHGTRAVLKSLWNDDSDVLSFLYKPKRPEAAVFTQCLNVEKDYPVVWEFLSKRHLFTTDLSNFDNRTVRLWSVKYPDSCLSFHNSGGLSFLRCHKQSRKPVWEHTRFVLLSERDGINKFTLQPDGPEESYVYSRLWVKFGAKPQASVREWRIQRVLHENKRSSASYLILLASQQNRCICTDWTGCVTAKQISQSDTKCFWEIEVLPECETEV